jgi:RIO kinase 1
LSELNNDRTGGPLDEHGNRAYSAGNDQTDPFAELDAYPDLPKIRNMPRDRQRPGRKTVEVSRKKPVTQIRAELADAEPGLEFSYNVQRDSHERMWLEDSLGEMIHLGWISDVLRQIKGGKEASVYLCAGTEMTGERFIAAKIYRPRMFRNLRNDHLYREGRDELDADGNRILDHGMQRAMERKTEYGQRLAHASWIEHEYQTMELLYKSGVRMPQPFARGDNAILMTYIGAETLPAPTLNTIDLDANEAEDLFRRSITYLDMMLAHDRIHADYSAYNILYWEGELWVIDFPQAVHPDENRSAYQLFERDVERICDYFRAQGVKNDPYPIAAQIWEKRRGRFRMDVHPGLLDAEDDEDRAYWDAITRS